MAQQRHPAGTPDSKGGQFAPSKHTESSGDLEEAWARADMFDTLPTDLGYDPTPLEQRNHFEGHYSNGQPIAQVWTDSADRPHRVDNPAIVEFNPDGSVRKESWYTHGVQHREFGPAVTHFHDNGKVQAEEYWLKGKPGREGDGPVLVEYREDGTLEHAEWGNPDGVRHRLDGPAVVDFYEDGAPKRDAWFKDGFEHRESGVLGGPDGPAVVEYNRDGSTARKQWMQNGSFYRAGGKPTERVFLPGGGYRDLWHDLEGRVVREETTPGKGK